MLHNEDEKKIKPELVLPKEWKSALEMACKILIIIFYVKRLSKVKVTFKKGVGGTLHHEAPKPINKSAGKLDAFLFPKQCSLCYCPQWGMKGLDESLVTLKPMLKTINFQPKCHPLY